MTDLQCACRQLLKNPGFTAVAVLTLALGIGANTAIFSVVNGVLLKPLPYPQPGQLVKIRKEKPPGDFPVLGGGELIGGHEFAAWREQSRTLAQIAAYGSDERSLTGSGLAERIRCGSATAGLFPMLGAKPQLGRLLLDDDEVPNGPRVTVLSHGFWHRKFGGSADVVGQSIMLDGVGYLVIGVLPASFQFPDPNDVWVPMQLQRGPEVVGGAAVSISLVESLARLKPGVTLAQAQTELRLIASRVTLSAFQFPPGEPGGMPVPPPAIVQGNSGSPLPPGAGTPPPPGDGPVMIPFPGDGQPPPKAAPPVLRPPPANAGDTLADVAQTPPVNSPGDANPMAAFGGGRIQLVGMHEHLVANVRRSLQVMMGAVGFVLLIACANVANLLLTRALSRRREIAVRLALGARRSQIIRQFLTESVLLSVVGGAVGVGFAWWGVRALDSLALKGSAQLQSVNLDPTVLGFTILVALGTGLIFGLAPAWQGAHLPVNDALKEGGHSAGLSHDGNRLRGLLVTGEVALALVMLVGAGLLLNSFVRLRSVNPGFQPDGVMTFQLNLGATGQPGGVRTAFARQLREELGSLPGVRSVAMTDHLPLTHYSIMTAVSVAGEPRERFAHAPAVSLAAVTTNYFETLGITVKAGRGWNASDEAAGNVAVNERFAREYFPGESAVGRRLNEFAGGTGTREIVGVVADARQDGLDSEVTPEIYSLSREPEAPVFSTALRFVGDPSVLARDIRERVLALNPSLVVSELMTLRERLDATTTPRRANLILLGSFASLALVLAVVGIYGVVSLMVSERTREIGVRVTLGARAADVIYMFLRRGMRLVMVGVVIGLAAAFWLARSMASLLFGISSSDPLTLLMVSALLAGVGMFACWVPARRAARVNPTEALRHE